MAKSINRVTLLGNAGKDPEVRTLPSGAKVATLTLATTERYREQSGNWKEKTEWHNLVAYAHIAEVIEKYVRKGSKIYIDGKIETRSWEANGEKKFQTQIKVEDLVLAGDPEARTESRPAPRPQAAPEPDWDDFR